MSVLRRAEDAGRGVSPVRTVGAFLAAGLLAVAALPARAAPTGTIVGRIVNGATDKPQARVEVTLTSVRRGDDRPELTTVRSDDRGRYSFKGLTTGDDRLYALDARFDGGLFVGSPISLPDDTSDPPVIETTLRVWPTTSDPSVIRIERDDLFVVPDEGDIAVIESVRVVNDGELAYIGRGDENAQTLGFALPAGAEAGGVQIIDSSIDVPEIVRTSFGFATTIAIPPGETQVTYSYRLQGVTGAFDLSRPALYPIAELTVHAADPLAIDSPRLQPAGEIDLERIYARWSSEAPIDAGNPVPITATAEGGNTPWLVAGLVAIGALMTTGVVVALARRKREPPERTRPVPKPRSREDVVAAIAELDLNYEAGEIGQQEWMSRRADLKDRLNEMRAPEPAP
ncbi:MAG: hypothetical protein ACRDKB_10070 [Actinomycetota bacterium]